MWTNVDERFSSVSATACLAQPAARKALYLVVVGSSPTVGVGTHDAGSCASVTAAVVHFETHSLCWWCSQGHSVL